MRQAVKERIDRDGFTIQPILGSPPYTYSIQLSTKIGYELIAVGVGSTAAIPVMAQLIQDLVVNGMPIELNKPMDKYSNFPIKLMEVKGSWAAPYATIAYEYNKDVKFLQMVYSDENGKFPGEEGYSFPAQRVLF